MAACKKVYQAICKSHKWKISFNAQCYFRRLTLYFTTPHFWNTVACQLNVTVDVYHENMLETFIHTLLVSHSYVVLFPSFTNATRSYLMSLNSLTDRSNHNAHFQCPGTCMQVYFIYDVSFLCNPVVLCKSSSNKVQRTWISSNSLQTSSLNTEVKRFNCSPLDDDDMDEGVCSFMLVFHLIRSLVTGGNIK